MATEKETSAATRNNSNSTKDAARTGETSASRTADHRAADASSDTVRSASRAMAETANRSANTARATAHDMASATDRAAKQMNRVFGLSSEAQEEMTQQTRENIESLAQCNGVLMEGMQSLWREWLGYSQEALRRQIAGLNTIARSRSVQDFYHAHSELVKDNTELLLDRSVKISELSAQVANNAVRRINASAQHRSHRS